MSDWEDLCEWMGVANDKFAVDKIVDYINRSNAEEDRRTDREASSSDKRRFNAFREATHWAKNNPGKVIKKSSDGEGFVEKNYDLV